MSSHLTSLPPYVIMSQEADFLADNIMIVHNGQVRAFGDPLFLKVIMEFIS